MKMYIIDNKDLMEEWFYDENEKIGYSPSKITLSNEKFKIFWKCKNCGNIWQTTAYKRSIGRGCPICGKKKSWETRRANSVKQKGSFATNFPELIEDWNYAKNFNIDPFKITSNSNIKISWKCHICGYEWIASANDRTRGKGCYNCNIKKVAIKQIKTKLSKTKSFAVAYPELLSDWDWENNNIDPYQICPSTHMSIHWICHKCNYKWKQYIYARVKGSGCPKCSKVKKYSLSEKIIYYFIKQHFENAIENYKPKFLYPKELDIFIPSINTAIEYDGERFHKNKLEDLSKNIMCEKNNVKLIRIREPKCPKLSIGENYCMKTTKDYVGAVNYIFETLNLDKKIIDDNINEAIKIVYSTINKNILKNSLGENFPELLNEWDYSNNGNINPFCVSITSNMKINWICNQGHTFTLPVAYRTKRKYGCPYCSGKKAILGQNDLKTKRPDLIPYWNNEKNLEFKMSDFKEHSTKKVYWKCPICKKEWILSIEAMCKRKVLCDHKHK